MVGPKSPTITTIDDLRDKKVCVVKQGSDTASVLEKFVPDAVSVERGSYSSCLDELRAGNVHAFTTDLTILYGYATYHPEMKVVKELENGNPVYYGVAFNLDDSELCRKAAEAIKEMVRSQQWDSFFNAHLDLYRADFPGYKTQIQPTDKQIDDNSCK